MKLLDEVSQHKGIPVIFHKKTRRVPGDRFLTDGNYVILMEKDFLSIISDATRYKKGFNEVIAYFDSVSDEEQPKLNNRLTKLGL